LFEDDDFSTPKPDNRVQCWFRDTHVGDIVGKSPAEFRADSHTFMIFDGSGETEWVEVNIKFRHVMLDAFELTMSKLGMEELMKTRGIPLYAESERDYHRDTLRFRWPVFVIGSVRIFELLFDCELFEPCDYGDLDQEEYHLKRLDTSHYVHYEVEPGYRFMDPRSSWEIRSGGISSAKLSDEDEREKRKFLLKEAIKLADMIDKEAVAKTVPLYTSLPIIEPVEKSSILRLPKSRIPS